eukprot:s201_g11.t1
MRISQYLLYLITGLYLLETIKGLNQAFPRRVTRRSRYLAMFKVLVMMAMDQRRTELIEDRGREHLKRSAPSAGEPDEEMIRDEGELDLDRLLNDPDYVPLGPIPPAPPHTPRPTSTFQQQRAEHERQDRPLQVMQREGALPNFRASPEQERVYAVTISAPKDAAEWRRMVKDPSKVVAKTMAEGVEVTWGRLSDRQRTAMQEAKGLEVQQWLRTKVARKVSEYVDPNSLIGMRWVMTFKKAEPDEQGNEQVNAKARIVVLGYSAPSLLEEPTTSPTISRLSRQLLLNVASAMKWPIASSDVKTAFLQARPEERTLWQSLFRSSQKLLVWALTRRWSLLARRRP